jgi:GT2 family glycosyltransferase
MGKVVVAIPYWESDDGKRKILQDCVNSLKGYDQLLVLAGKQPTLPLAWNMCLELAFGMGADYVVLSNDDIILTKGLISDLCKENTVVSPLVNGGAYKKFHAHMFCLPRTVYEKVGKMDERFAIYWADTDYCKRLVDAGFPIETNDKVDIQHKEAARTLKHLAGITEKSDRDIFVEKWGREWFDPSMGK